MSDEITYLPLSALLEHPDNTRKAYSEAYLSELAQSIAAQGVLQPIVVRPLPSNQLDMLARFEIVFGHRRYRACSRLPGFADSGAGLHMPCIVREMTDSQAALAQVAENLQRQDVTALEEADGLVRLAKVHGMTADDIAAQIGKSRSYVYARLKLAAASHDVREAITTEGLSPETALEVARLRGDKLQRLGLKACRSYDGEWLSQRQAKAAVHRLFDCRLADAEFDDTDPDLLPFASACTYCPKRAGNDPDLAELAADVCTDPKCYADKQRAHTDNALPALREQGIAVITAGDAADLKLFPNPARQVADGYREADDAAVVWQTYTGQSGDHGYERRTLAQMLAELAAAGVACEAPARVAIVCPHTGTHRLYWADDAVQKVVDKFKALWLPHTGNAAARHATGDTGGAGDGGAGLPDQTTAHWPDDARALLDLGTLHAVRDTVFTAAVAGPRTAEELRDMLRAHLTLAGNLEPAATVLGIDAQLLAAEQLADEADDAFYAEDWLRGWVDTAAPDFMAAALVVLALNELMVSNIAQRDLVRGRQDADDLLAIARRYGVDVLAVARQQQTMADPVADDLPSGVSA